ncbi:sensor histidine kinase [Streptomyces sp. LN325]|uniref:sensor histidine kinase n=1 Tax=Streptomyces sp. LN325 TaxID=3112976 RepID=UPI003720EDAA
MAWGGLAVAVGGAVRSRQGDLTAVEERARHAEHNRDEEARRRVVEERLRIARDLHDVVAHHIAVINVQVGVVSVSPPPSCGRSPPGPRRRWLTSGGPRAPYSPISPPCWTCCVPGSRATRPPGLSRLATMLDALGAAGPRVEHRQEGEARPLPSAVDLAAYRIVQESLTNAHKHGSEPVARLRLDYTPAGLGIVVENAAAQRGPDAHGTGHGLIGLRERVSSIGGTVRTGRDDGGRFTVSAFLPVASEPVDRTDRQETRT